MDATDLKILELLQINARISMKKLGEIVGLTSPAVSERVRRLEEHSVIKSYRAIIDPDKINKSIKAFITISIKTHNYSRFKEHAPENPYIIEAHHVTGGDSMILKVIVRDMAELETVIDGLKTYGDTQTNLILSSPIEGKPII